MPKTFKHLPAQGFRTQMIVPKRWRAKQSKDACTKAKTLVCSWLNLGPTLAWGFGSRVEDSCSSQEYEGVPRLSILGHWNLIPFWHRIASEPKKCHKVSKGLGIRQGLMSLRLSKYVFFCKSCSWPTAIPSLFGGQAAQRFQRDLWIYGSILKRTSLGGCLKNLMAPHEAKWRTRPLYMGDLLIEVVWGFKIDSRRRTNRTRSWRSNLKYVFASRSNRCAKIMWFAVHLALLRLGYGSNCWSPKNWMAAWIQRMTKSCLLNVDLYWPMRSTSLDSGHNS